MKRNKLFQEQMKMVSPEVKQEMDWSFDIVSRIHNILEEQGITQGELAKRIGCSERQITRWTTGFPDFTLSALAKLSNALGEPLIMVIGGDDTSGMYDTIERGGGIEKVWLTEDAVWIRTTDGEEACEYFADYPRLKAASPEQRANYVADEFGINWPEIDEDLCYEGFFKEKTRTDLYRLFMAHPELNASAVARRMGISQSLFAQYISGVKKPSQARLSEIYATIHAIGEELVAIPAR